MLLLGEGGAILFIIANGIIATQNRTISLVFKFFAGLCSLFAIVSNIAITQLNPVIEMSVLQWLMAIGIPTIVLGVGILFEQLILVFFKARTEKKRRYNLALQVYDNALQ